MDPPPRGPESTGPTGSPDSCSHRGPLFCSIKLVPVGARLCRPRPRVAFHVRAAACAGPFPRALPPPPCQLAMSIPSIHVLTAVYFGLSILVWFAFTLAYSFAYELSNLDSMRDFSRVGLFLLSNPALWLMLPVCVAAPLIVDSVVHKARRFWRPTFLDIVQEWDRWVAGPSSLPPPHTRPRLYACACSGALSRPVEPPVRAAPPTLCNIPVTCAWFAAGRGFGTPMSPEEVTKKLRGTEKDEGEAYDMVSWTSSGPASDIKTGIDASEFLHWRTQIRVLQVRGIAADPPPPHTHSRAFLHHSPACGLLHFVTFCVDRIVTTAE
jgi:hypothetical protein